MNPNTTAQRKTTKTAGKTNDRPRGAMAHILDSAKLVEAAREVLRAEGEYSPLLIAAILVIIAEAARSATMSEWLTFVPTAIFLAATGLAVCRFYRRLTPPR